MIIVLDASAAFDVCSKKLRGFGMRSTRPLRCLALIFLCLKVCNALRKYVRVGIFSRRQNDELIGDALALIPKTTAMRELVPDVLALSVESQVSTYDLFYLALAKRNGATLLTADKALRRAALGMGLDAPGEELM